MNLNDIDWTLEGPETIKAQENPLEWTKKKLEENTDFLFTVVEENVFRASSLVKDQIVTIDVTCNPNGMIDIEAYSPSFAFEEENLSAVIAYLMYENGTIKHLGFKMPEVGKPLAFGSTHLAEDGFDIDTFLKRAVRMAGAYVAKVKRVSSTGDLKEQVENDTRLKFARMLL